MSNSASKFGQIVLKCAPKRTETDLKKSQICPIWGQSDPIWMPNLRSLIGSWVSQGCEICVKSDNPGVSNQVIKYVT